MFPQRSRRYVVARTIQIAAEKEKTHRSRGSPEAEAAREPPRPRLKKTKKLEDETSLQDETLSASLSPLDSKEPAPDADLCSPLEKPPLPVEKNLADLRSGEALATC